MLDAWALDPSITYLNHGTVGCTPRRVLEAQRAIRDAIERQPSRFQLRELTAIRVGGPRAEPPRMRVAAAAVAAFVGARGEDLVFVDNATTGVNAVLRSFDLAPGDEILVTDLTYGAVRNVAAFVARERGARLGTIAMPFPWTGPGAFVEAVEAALGPRTRIAVLDHIASESALLLPIAEMVERCHARGVAVLVDGAHAPGAIALDVPAIGADWYVANLHKWGWAPRSSGFLWARPERQAGLHPPVISWGLDQGFTAEFDLVGTRDPSPWLAAPDAIAFMGELGVERVMAWNHALAREAGALIAGRFGVPFTTPASMIGAMVTVPLPASLGAAPVDAARLRDALLFEDRIEAQIHAWRGRLWTRISAQIYNQRSDVERLVEGVAKRA
jgi:isopenicillin-N epimerase